MPRWASRITLEITDVRVERLQDISEAGAKAEGVDPQIMHATFGYGGTLNDEHQYARGYRDLWNSINGEGSWALNPWVWCVSFRKVAT